MKTPLLLAVSLGLTSAGLAAVKPNPLFSQHAVLQADREIPVWGTADEGEKVTVEFNGSRVSTTTVNGRWRVLLPAQKAGGPHVLRIQGANTIEAGDVLVGEVWVASGQSNMERQLGPRPPQKPIIGGAEAAARADYPQLRQFRVANLISDTEVPEASGEWVVCTPKTAEDFSAVGFFFGESLLKSEKRPVGLLFTSWGGTPAESWVSRPTLETIPDFAQALALRADMLKDQAHAREKLEKAWADWYEGIDEGSRGTPWFTPSLDDAAWSSQALPGYFEEAGLPNFDGIVWYRRSFDLAPGSVSERVLHLGPIDDNDTVWVNGHLVGHTENYAANRNYTVPAAFLKEGRNVIAVRVADTGGNGGFWAQAGVLRLENPAKAGDAVSLEGAWKRRIGGKMDWAKPVPVDYFTASPNVPGVLFNGMIAPVAGYAIRGAIWYQGESNVGRHVQYRTLFPTMIKDWRARWGQGEFPFLFVQLAPFATNSPELREAQFLTLRNVPNTAMAVTTDCGDATDIHPADKGPVGLRLAAAARALAYGSSDEYSGPHYTGAWFEGARAVLTFGHLGGGLVAKGGRLDGFTAEGLSGENVPVSAVIEGDHVVVTSTNGAALKAVRYAWATVAEGSLYNQAGFPASPFRTDAP